MYQFAYSAIDIDLPAAPLPLARNLSNALELVEAAAGADITVEDRLRLISEFSRLLLAIEASLKAGSIASKCANAKSEARGFAVEADAPVYPLEPVA